MNLGSKGFELWFFQICSWVRLVSGSTGSKFRLFEILEPFELCPDIFGFLMAAFRPDSFGIFSKIRWQVFKDDKCLSVSTAYTGSPNICGINTGQHSMGAFTNHVATKGGRGVENFPKLATS